MDNREKVRLLLKACEEGNASAIHSILDVGVDVNACDDNYSTALQAAAGNGHDNIVRLLLMRGAALDQPNEFGFTALLQACRNGYVHVVQLLLQNQADINARTKLGANALTLAACGGHLQICKLLIESSIDQSPATGIGGSTCEFDALLAAAHHGHDTVVRYLLDRGYDVNYRTPSLGLNALMLAALNGHMTTCQVLLERGANPNLTNVNDHTPLQIATLKNTREVKGYLERKTTNKPKLSPEQTKPDIIDAAKSGDLERIQEVLTSDPGQVDACSPQDGATPLMFAAMNGRLDIAQVLVVANCDIDKQDCVSGWTALMQATYHGKKAVAKFLINAGANVLLPANNGCTAFDLATLIDDVDTELYRLLAAKAFQIDQVPTNPNPNNTSKVGTGSKFMKPNGTRRGSTAGVGGGGGGGEAEADQQKTGLKAWWNRMSNRFRNLKLGRTFNANRLGPLPVETQHHNSDSPIPNGSPKGGTLPASSTKRKSISGPGGEDSRASRMHKPGKLTTEMNTDTMQSYETLLLDTQKNASTMFTLSMAAAANNVSSNSHQVTSAGTLWPVIPPFRPPPTFETDRPKMPPSNTRGRSMTSLNSTSTLGQQRSQPPMKLLQNNKTSSPSASAASFAASNNASPSSSAGASALHPASSASSSTLTAGSADRYGGPNSSAPLTPTTPRDPPSFLPPPMYRSPMFVKPASSSSTISTLELTKNSIPRRGGGGGGGGSSTNDSASTLTPMSLPRSSRTHTSHTASSASKSHHRPAPFQAKPSISEEDELGTLFKKLSLEGYQAIFEEQEVDMEAFLTLSENDLQELGISHTEPRRQILAAITELNSGKGRERQQLQDTMDSYTLASATASSWEHASTPASKSRAS